MKMLAIAPEIVVATTACVLAAAVAMDWNTIILACIGLAGAWISMKVATLAAAAKEAKEVTTKTAETMEKIHVSVNSKESATAKKIEDLTATVLTLSKTIEKLEEGKRGADLAKSIADAQGKITMPVAVMPTQAQAPTAPAAVAETAKSTTRIADAIDELTDAAEETSESADKTVDLAKKHPR